MTDNLKAAVVQAGSVAFDVEATLAKADRLLAEAAEAGAGLAVFPEAFISAYPKGLDFGCRVGMRKPEGREQFQRYWDSAIDVPGPATEALAGMAARHNMYIVMGVIERDVGTLYCTVLYFSPAGELLGKHRKLMPTASERLVWGQGDGSTLPVFDTPHGRLGAVICWENYMPLFRAAMYAKGVKLYCAPTADDRDTWLATIRHIAVEGRCFVLSACQVMRRSDFPADYPVADEMADDQVLMRGSSCIIGPLGEVLAGPLFNEEGILYADLDIGEVTRSHLDLDPVGHYSRPDIFQLNVDERSRPAANFINDSASRETDATNTGINEKNEWL